MLQIVVLTALVLAAPFVAAIPATADSCPYAAQAAAAKARMSAAMKKLEGGDCSANSTLVQAVREHNTAIANAVSNCTGYSYTTRGDSDYAGVEREGLALCKAARKLR
jgi:hypothetical protein